MSINKYEAFIKTVELGSLTRAGEALGYTQSGVSHMISTLEDELGFPLLRRSRAGVSLTAFSIYFILKFDMFCVLRHKTSFSSLLYVEKKRRIQINILPYHSH